jgi:hypothetical protein
MALNSGRAGSQLCLYTVRDKVVKGQSYGKARIQKRRRTLPFGPGGDFPQLARGAEPDTSCGGGSRGVCAGHRRLPGLLSAQRSEREPGERPGVHGGCPAAQAGAQSGALEERPELVLQGRSPELWPETGRAAEPEAGGHGTDGLGAAAHRAAAPEPLLVADGTDLPGVGVATGALPGSAASGVGGWRGRAIAKLVMGVRFFAVFGGTGGIASRAAPEATPRPPRGHPQAIW